MAYRVTLWYDREGDYLEVTLERRPGWWRTTDDDAVMVKVDEQGRMIGFSVQGLSRKDRQEVCILTTERVTPEP